MYVGSLAAVAEIAVATPTKPTAFDASRKAGIADQARTYSASVYDYNRDGWDDILMVRHKGFLASLYRNDGGRFTTVDTQGAFPLVDRHECDWADVNRDARPDVYCTVGAVRGHGSGPNELWLQRHDGSFVNRAEEWGVTDPWGRGRGVTFIDVNHDRFLDLYVGNRPERSDARISTNKLFINVGGERFRRAPEYRVNRRIGGASVQAVDYDGDGWSDLLVCGVRHVYLYRNMRGERFADVSRRTGVDRPCEVALFANVNGDRRPDLIRLTKRRLEIRRQRDRAFRTTLHRRRLARGRDVAVGRVDSDRRPDLYVQQAGPIDNDRPDLMLLNRDGGRRFAQMRIPQTRQGKGDAVSSIDHDRNGRTDFIVLNGQGEAIGPIRLVAFR